MRTALIVAIGVERDLIECYRDRHTGKVDEMEPGIITARRRIAAFERVLNRYFGGTTTNPIDNAKRVSVFEIIKRMQEDETDCNR
jgi:hypothetical protein